MKIQIIPQNTKQKNMYQTQEEGKCYLFLFFPYLFLCPCLPYPAHIPCLKKKILPMWQNMKARELKNPIFLNPWWIEKILQPRLIFRNPNFPFHSWIWKNLEMQLAPNISKSKVLICRWIRKCYILTGNLHKIRMVIFQTWWMRYSIS